MSTGGFDVCNGDLSLFMSTLKSFISMLIFLLFSQYSSLFCFEPLKTGSVQRPSCSICVHNHPIMNHDALFLMKCLNNVNWEVYIHVYT